MPHQSGRRPIGGFLKRLSGLLVPRRVQDVQDQTDRREADRERRRQLTQKLALPKDIDPRNRQLAERKLTKRPAAHVKAENRRRNRAARKSRRRNRV